MVVNSCALSGDYGTPGITLYGGETEAEDGKGTCPRKVWIYGYVCLKLNTQLSPPHSQGALLTRHIKGTVASAVAERPVCQARASRRPHSHLINPPGAPRPQEQDMRSRRGDAVGPARAACGGWAAARQPDSCPLGVRSACVSAGLATRSEASSASRTPNSGGEDPALPHTARERASCRDPTPSSHGPPDTCLLRPCLSRRQAVRPRHAGGPLTTLTRTQASLCLPWGRARRVRAAAPPDSRYRSYLSTTARTGAEPGVRATPVSPETHIDARLPKEKGLRRKTGKGPTRHH